MTEYIRALALVLIGVILSVVVGRQSRDMSLLLTLAVCALVCLGALEFLEPVVQLLQQLQSLGALDTEAITILLKSALIGLSAELAGLLCADAGENALGKALQVLANAAVLWLSLPLFRQILGMIEEVLAQI